jgi:hypothetical protein
VKVTTMSDEARNFLALDVLGEDLGDDTVDDRLWRRFKPLLRRARLPGRGTVNLITADFDTAATVYSEAYEQILARRGPNVVRG